MEREESPISGDASRGKDGEENEADVDESQISKCRQRSTGSASEAPSSAVSYSYVELDVHVYCPNVGDIWTFSPPDTMARLQSGTLHVDRYAPVARPGAELFEVTFART
ncbi:hypothetical protein PISMIDRAFT_13001 [Pisolithus microcarpus 441]|uniref:Uncharacterized protein n=1 Tax=Pisolithus microcarpus 441 TaxID=765257 RepID=A0A0C9Z2F2_9AGAM|nr:hypothetical protein PISMIDRAFT_13001 [Pisolithus microcarpus 441]